MINWEKVDQINLGYKVLLAAGKYSEFLQQEIYRYWYDCNDVYYYC